MNEFMRLITNSTSEISFENIEEVLEDTDMKMEIVKDESGKWKELVVKREDTNQVVTIITKSENIEEEKKLLTEGLADSEPVNAAEWVMEYLKSAKTIYKFEIFEGSDDQYGWYTLESIREAIWEEVEGILQNDGEGYRNEEGFFIVWQFEYEVEGPYEAAVMDKKGKWQCFEMELSDEEHIAQFKKGKVPQGLEILEF